ncbi:MAG TPA: hypothetical protein VH661_09705 [Candidatus Dormibacteraeota bacterium]|nr:hypothetical protein [Candidatus Dormibacteraeota bacterium]
MSEKGRALSHAQLRSRARQARLGEDERVATAFEHAKSGVVMTLTLDDLMSLCWQDSHHVRLLVTSGADRSVGAVARRFLDAGMTWEALASGMIPGEYVADWFTPCLEYATAVRDLAAGELVLVPATPRERDSADQATYYIFDGVHRCIVAAVEHLAGRTQYRPLIAVSIEPRPG